MYSWFTVIPTYVYWGLQDTANMVKEDPLCGVLGLTVVFGFMLWMFLGANKYIVAQKSRIPLVQEDEEEPRETRPEGGSLVAKRQEREQRRLGWGLNK